MGIVYLKEKKIYEMFGISVYGKVDRYTWSIYPDKPDAELIMVGTINEAIERFK